MPLCFMNSSVWNKGHIHTAGVLHEAAPTRSHLHHVVLMEVKMDAARQRVCINTSDKTLINGLV